MKNLILFVSALLCSSFLSGCFEGPTASPQSESSQSEQVNPNQDGGLTEDPPVKETPVEENTPPIQQPPIVESFNALIDSPAQLSMAAKQDLIVMAQVTPEDRLLKMSWEYSKDKSNWFYHSNTAKYLRIADLTADHAGYYRINAHFERADGSVEVVYSSPVHLVVLAPLPPEMEPISCNGHPVGYVGNARTRYKDRMVMGGAQCQKETQTQVCQSNGMWSDYSGTFKELSCMVHMPSPSPAPAGNTLAEYCNKSMGHHGMEHNHSGVHSSDPAKAAEHMSAMGLVTANTATHTVVRCGLWSQASTWKNGQIPGDNAKVYVPNGLGVTYDVASSKRLRFIKVDGFMDFATNKNTKLYIDTLVSTPSSIINIGTKKNPISNAVKAEIVVVDNGAIDRNLDPEQVSRGVIFHGKSEIHGAKKKSHFALAVEPSAGDTQIKVEGNPKNWNVGDEIVVIGTHFNTGIKRLGALPSQDEVRKIAAVNGSTITIDQPLQFNHDVYPGHGFKSHVGISSRNVVIRSENPNGVRGHFMVMHSPHTRIRYAEFRDLGRSDRRIPISDINIIGRYPLHIHRAGATEHSMMAIVEGNSVINGPGWGIVHHDSVAAVNHNFVFNIIGAGIVAEAGNEVGEWVGNLVSSVTGSGRGKVDRKTYGPAHRGMAYFAASRAVIQQYNIAANTYQAWDFEGRLGEVTNFLVGGFAVSPRAFKFNSNPFRDHKKDTDMHQIIGFEGNRAYALQGLIHSTHRSHGEVTNTVNEIRDFKAWRIHNSALNFRNYTWDYVFRDCVFVGAPGNRAGAAQAWKKTEGMSYVNVHFENFNIGVQYDLLNHNGILHNVTYKNVKTPVSSLTDRMVENGQTIPHPVTKQPYVPQAYPLEYSKGNVTALPKPIVNITSKNAAIFEGSRGAIKGTVTDSFGTYKIGESIWWTSPGNYTKPKVKFADWSYKMQDSPSSSYLKDILPYNGVIKKDGKWQMPVTLWIADRFTGFNHPYTVYFEVLRMDENFLKQHEITDYKEPTKDLNLYDETTDYYLD